METQQVENPIQQPEQVHVPAEPKHHLPIKVLLIALVFILGSAVGVYGFQWYQMQNEVVEMPEENLVETGLRPVSTSKSMSNETADWETYRNEEYGYSVSYPADWDLFEEPVEASRDLIGNELQKVYFTKNYISELSDSYFWPKFFEIKVLQNPNGYTLEEWAENYQVPLGVNPETNLAKLVGDTMINNKPAKQFSVFQFDSYNIETVTIYNEFVYKLTYSDAQGNDPDYESSRKVYNQILSTFRFLDEVESEQVTTTIPSAQLISDISDWKTETIQSLKFKIPPQASIKEYNNVNSQTSFKILNHDPNNLNAQIYPDITVVPYQGGSRRQQADFGNLPLDQFVFTEKQYGPHSGLIADFQCEIPECIPGRYIVFVVGNQLVQISEGTYKSGSQGTENSPYSTTRESIFTNTIISTFQSIN